MNKIIKRLVVATPFALGVFVAHGAAAADPATGPNGEFLCPAVGNATAADANGKGWESCPMPTSRSSPETIKPERMRIRTR